MRWQPANTYVAGRRSATYGLGSDSQHGRRASGTRSTYRAGAARDRIRGCLLGLAVGDAWASRSSPAPQPDPEPVRARRPPATWRRGVVTWGLVAHADVGGHGARCARLADGERLDARGARGRPPGAGAGRLAAIPGVIAQGEWQGRRGTACMTALHSEKPVDSKGCGGVMRAAEGCAGHRSASRRFSRPTTESLKASKTRPSVSRSEASPESGLGRASACGGDQVRPASSVRASEILFRGLQSRRNAIAALGLSGASAG